MMKYVPYAELDNLAHIIVDGAPHKDTEIILSHWSNSGTEPSLIRDTSAEIVFDYLEQHAIPCHIQAVSNNHFDQDGLVSVFALTQPELAQKYRALLIDVAEAGDFGKYKDKKAAQIAILINTMITPEAGFFDASVFSLPYADMAAVFYRELLKHLPGMLEDIKAYHDLWQDEYMFLEHSTALIEAGQVTITEDMENDIAIITIPEVVNSQLPTLLDHRTHFGGIHEFAIHNATPRARLLYVQGHHIQFKYRYETWVQLKNNIHPLRVNLSPLAEQLSELDDVKWVYQGSEGFAPLLYIDAQIDTQKTTSLPLNKIESMLKHTLKTGDVDWSPYPTSSSTSP